MSRLATCLDDRELGAVLTGLRVVQAAAREQDPPNSAWLAAILTGGGKHQPLMPAEIDHLCERLNTGDDMEAPLELLAEAYASHISHEGDCPYRLKGECGCIRTRIAACLESAGCEVP